MTTFPDNCSSGVTRMPLRIEVFMPVGDSKEED
jgi:hypothetical protein